MLAAQAGDYGHLKQDRMARSSILDVYDHHLAPAEYGRQIFGARARKAVRELQPVKPCHYRPHPSENSVRVGALRWTGSSPYNP